MRHSKSLDGIRAIAVMLVMLFHFGYFAPGWAGVQIFFALSGYLITGGLLRDKQRAFGPYMSTFFWHRALRIYPVLAVFILATWFCYSVFGVPESFPSDWPWVISFTANLSRLRRVDLGPAFVHMWSLALEQQFYLVWPLLTFFLPRNAFRVVVAGLMILTPLLRLAIFDQIMRLGYDATFAGEAVYVLPFAQFDAFAAGAAIPLWGLDASRNSGRLFLLAVAVLGVAGLGVLLPQYFGGHGAFIGSLGYPMYLIPGYGFVWGYSLLNLCSMLAIMCTSQRIGPNLLLESRALVWVGKVSYGVYVYHVPLLLIGFSLMDRWNVESSAANRVVLFVGWVACVLVTAAASHRWLETPFLKLKNYWWERPRALRSSG